MPGAALMARAVAARPANESGGACLLSQRPIQRLVIALVVAGGACAWAQPSEDQSYRTGIGLLNKGLSDMAAEQFRTYLREHPDGVEATNARYSLAVCLTRMGRDAEASEQLERVLAVEGFEFA